MENTKKSSHKAFKASALTGIFFMSTLSTIYATDFAGSLKTVTITDALGTNKAPTANFTYTVSGDTVMFDATKSADSDGVISKYAWDFGDGVTGEGAIVSHTYGNSDVFQVTLAVTDDASGVSVTKNDVQTEIDSKSLFVSGDNYGYAAQQYSGYKYLAGSFTADNKYTIYQIEMYMYKAGSPTGEYTVEIRGDNDGEPGDVLNNGTSTDSYFAADLSGVFYSRELKVFNFSPVQIDSGVRYWVSVKSTDSDGDSNYIGTTKTSSNISEYFMRSADSLSWIKISSSQSLYFVLKGN